MAGACVPYAVGSTAQTVPEGEWSVSSSIFAIPNGIDGFDDSTSHPVFGVDPEARLGIGEGLDVGLRLPSFSGAVVTLKKRLGDNTDTSRAAIAIVPGAGIVNAGYHAIVEFTVIASGRQRTTVTPYGGIRAMQVFPISRGSLNDSPSAGGFLGMRIGTRDLGISPEIGVFYDRSALDLRTSKVIFVPSVTVHGERLLRLF